ncbi:MAG: hypothetical protein JSV56_11495, partial [Methanomassiliicoccales archaeon]
MRGERKIWSMLVACILLVAIFVTVPIVVQADWPKTVYGNVEPNSTTGVRAWDPTQYGNMVFYIQNWMNNGTSTEDVQENTSSARDYYVNTHVGDDVTWYDSVGELGVVIINREDGTGADREGYVAYTSAALTANNQKFPDCELRKIPVPTFVNNGTDFINISWEGLTDPDNLIAGYTVYRSTDNSTWTRVSGDKDSPVPKNQLYFNDSVSQDDYYYCIKVCFIGYEDDDPGIVNNYECMY